ETMRRGWLSQSWQVRLRNAAGECHQRAVDQMLKERHYNEALQHALEAGQLLGLEEREQRGRVIEGMLAEVRRLFASGTGPDETHAPVQMIARTVRVAGRELPEASFWQALCLVRQGEFDQALATMTALYEQAGKQVLDLPLYMGIMMHRLGRPQEALRYLSEA